MPPLMLAVLDEFTRKCLRIRIGRLIGAAKVDRRNNELVSANHAVSALSASPISETTIFIPRIPILPRWGIWATSFSEC